MGQPESFPVCRGCGILAPSNQASCPRCGTATGEHVAWVPFRSDGTVSVALEMEFQCRACGHWAPANYLDLDGSLACAHCGIEQAFAPKRFRQVLYEAHDVGDLAGPNPEGHPANRTEPIGADNPYAAIGTSADLRAVELKRFDELDLKVKLRLTRGRPLCHSCQMPVELYPDGQGQVTTVCSYCQQRAEYALPPGARDLYPPLVGVVADEHRSDCKRSETVASSDAGPVAIQCPSCHAPLKVSGTSAFVKCQYCSTQSVIPVRAWTRAAGDKAKARMWFALLRGPSQKRARLNASALSTRQRQATPRPDTAAGRPRPHRLEGRPKRRGPWLAIILGAVLVISVAAFAYVQVLERTPRQESVGSTAKRPKKAKVPTKKGPPARSLFDQLDYCTCLTELDGKTGLENVTLAQRTEYEQGGKIRLELYMDVEGGKPLYLPLSAETAPTSHPKGATVAIGIACEKQVVALISGHYATGWSAKTGKKLWSKRIAGSYDHPKPPPPKEGQFSTWCEQLRPVGGHATLNIGGGKTLQVRIKDGRLTMR